MFLEVALAQSAAGGPQPTVIEQLMPFVFIFFIFYFLIIRPQQKRHKKHQTFLGGIKRGDSVLTTGGIFGTIEGITDQFVTLEVSDGVRIRILKTQIASGMDDGDSKNG